MGCFSSRADRDSLLQLYDELKGLRSQLPDFDTSLRNMERYNSLQIRLGRIEKVLKMDAFMKDVVEFSQLSNNPAHPPSPNTAKRNLDRVVMKLAVVTISPPPPPPRPDSDSIEQPSQPDTVVETAQRRHRAHPTQSTPSSRRTSWRADDARFEIASATLDKRRQAKPTNNHLPKKYDSTSSERATKEKLNTDLESPRQSRSQSNPLELDTVIPTIKEEDEHLALVSSDSPHRVMNSTSDVVHSPRQVLIQKHVEPNAIAANTNSTNETQAQPQVVGEDDENIVDDMSQHGNTQHNEHVQHNQHDGHTEHTDQPHQPYQVLTKTDVDRVSHHVHSRKAVTNTGLNTANTNTSTNNHKHKYGHRHLQTLYIVLMSYASARI
eukprot:m.175809 g.175809  ORF g.175809 m.175809 type:complete len:380 (-) comp31832_c0_seq1:28-1167(-)